MSNVFVLKKYLTWEKTYANKYLSRRLKEAWNKSFFDLDKTKTVKHMKQATFSLLFNRI